MDLEASRLVFVSIQDAKPKRKVAVPIPDDMTWEAFLQTVQAKLKLSGGIASVVLASSGERVLRLDQLQDIDELYVTEGTAAQPSNGSAFAGVSNANSHQQRMGVADSEITPMLSSQLAEDANEDSKYVKRQSSVQLTMKRVFPSLFQQQSLPVTTKDTGPLSPVEQVRRRVRRRRRSWSDPRLMLVVFALLSCAATLAFVYLRATQALP